MKSFLQLLFDKKKLSQEEAKAAMLKMAQPDQDIIQSSAFITVFLMRKIELTELIGFRKALMELGRRVDLSDYNPMDICGTGGDNKNTFNISTVAAFVAAGAGVKVAKHGNYAVSSSCGSSNVLEYFGYRFTDSEIELKNQMETAGICFLHAPLFQPALEKVSEIRKVLQVKTFFNMLGPLINPASPKKQVLGVYSLELAELYAKALQKTDIHYTIIHSLDGYDEISLTGNYQLINREANKVVDPQTMGFCKVSEGSITGGENVEDSSKIFMKILQGEGTTEQNDVVVANASIAIQSYYSTISQADSIEMARESLLSKKALQTFKKLII